MKGLPYEYEVMKESGEDRFCFVRENQIFNFKATSLNLRHQLSCIKDAC